MSSQNQAQQQALSRLRGHDILYAQKRATLECRKKEIEMRFESLRQHKQARLRQQRNTYAADIRNPISFPPHNAVDFRAHHHYNTEPVLYPDSPTLGPWQDNWQQVRDIPCDSTLSQTEPTVQYLPATTYDPTAIAVPTVRPVTHCRDLNHESSFLQAHFAQPITRRDTREAVCPTDLGTDYLREVHGPKSILKDSQTSFKPSFGEGKSLERDTSDETTEAAFQNVIDGSLEKWHINNMSGVGHQEHLQKGNVTVPSPSAQNTEARASISRPNAATDRLNCNRFHLSTSCYPLPIPPKPSVDSSGSSADKVTKTASLKIGNRKPTQNDSGGLNKPEELQKPHVVSKSAVKGMTSRPGLKLDTTFLSCEPEAVEWSDNDSIKATAGSTIADELNANELLAETDCHHIQSTAHESILTSFKTSKIDATVMDRNLGSNEKIMGTTSPPPTKPQETQTKVVAVDDKEEVKPNLEDDLEILTLTSEENNSPSPDIDNQLDGTSWEKIDAKGAEQDDAFFHQVANPQTVGWGEAARRTAWGWLR